MTEECYHSSIAAVLCMG